MKRSAILIVILFLLLLNLPAGPVSASSDPDNDRVIYHWILAQWKDNVQVCRIDINHQGLPTGQEIISQCGQEIFDLFFLTPSCDFIESGTIESCEGLYLKQIESSMEWTSHDYLDPVLLRFEFPDCEIANPGFYCEEIPLMAIIILEDYAKDLEIQVVSNFEEEGVRCLDAKCEIDLFSSGEYGTNLNVIISDQVTNHRYEQNFRIQSIFLEEDEDAPRPEGWWVQVRSQHRFGKADISNIWGLEIPELLPDWLAHVENPEDLATETKYYFLAGRMIAYGLASPGTCPSKGLTIEGYANECGLSAVYRGMIDWQNQFDNGIFFASDIVGISPILLKNLFAKESQFWPQNDLVEFEFGFGHMTPDGADNLFMWNYNFFDRYCVLKFGYRSGCGFGYTELSDEQRALLIDELLTDVSVFCESCDILINYAHVNFSIEVFGEVLLAYSTQTGNIIENITGEPAGTLSIYEDLWRFTLANYNGGAGCLADAIETTWDSNVDLSWENVSLNFSEECSHVPDYVNDIAPNLEDID